MFWRERLADIITLNWSSEEKETFIEITGFNRTQWYLLV